MPNTDNLNLVKISSVNETIGTHFPTAYNGNMDTIDAAVGDNASDISALDTRMTTAEGEIDALNQSLANMSIIVDNGWNVRKFPDGSFTAVKQVAVTTSTGTAWGATGFYYHTLTSAITFPSLTKAVRTWVASPTSSLLSVVCGASAFTSSGLNLYLADATSVSSTKYVTVILEGTWE